MGNTGRSTFERRSKKTPNNTVIEYMQRVKTEASKKELGNNRKSIS
jgi:hypothetical protein